MKAPSAVAPESPSLKDDGLSTGVIGIPAIDHSPAEPALFAPPFYVELGQEADNVLSPRPIRLSKK